MIVDGVFSGGGIKGFAYVGALQVLEERGIQFSRVAGTSAGAILAAFIAAGYNAQELEEVFDELNLNVLLDPPKICIGMPFLKWVNLYVRFGMYRGKTLEKWFYQKLASKGIYSFGDLPEGSLKLLASDLTNGRIVVLPDDLKNYGINARTFPISHALRMSCGLPFFYEPVYLKNGTSESVIVDGGVLSNFPLWIFDNGNQKRPILGLKLSSANEEMAPREIDNGIQLFEALFATMQNAHDNRYIARRHEKDIIFIPVEKFSATQFDIDEETKHKLMSIGKERTIQFLKTWSPIW
ncbi:patatin-like phospholipase family protein [Solibacillus sp. MA9]|uniref:Patatin-like phospholipase family protein n=1 Tax=Solibacillus palustris TaxID=2908203 RepID=A0ABS9UFP2_9BACL|nr:patatin-like phospholipase family protein [Solibacillus sp. MA9]MCH7323186.1 patatin-like phospholipase family protein [Solibacillus sp. MA9]